MAWSRVFREKGGGGGGVSNAVGMESGVQGGGGG